MLLIQFVMRHTLVTYIECVTRTEFCTALDSDIGRYLIAWSNCICRLSWVVLYHLFVTGLCWLFAMRIQRVNKVSLEHCVIWTVIVKQYASLKKACAVGQILFYCLLSIIYISSFLFENLILVQIECWRRGWGMQVERNSGVTRYLVAKGLGMHG